MQIEFTFHGSPVPAQRVQVGNRHGYNPAKYRKYKKALADALAKAFPEFVDKGPPTSNKKERRKWLKVNKDVQYRLDYWVFIKKDLGDWDNYGKSISDAIQNAGLVPDDKKIKKGSWEVQLDKENPRIHFRLERL